MTSIFEVNRHLKHFFLRVKSEHAGYGFPEGGEQNLPTDETCLHIILHIVTESFELDTNEVTEALSHWTYTNDEKCKSYANVLR